MKNKFDIIFTGLFRNFDLLKKSVLDFSRLRKRGLVDKIIFSTWDYEVKNNGDAASFLRKNKVEIIANKEPENKGIGNIFCQMKSLEEGLKKNRKR